MKIMIKSNKPRGLTLIELVVAVSLFATLTVIVTRVFMRVADVQEKVNQEQNLEGDLRYAINVLTDEASKAQKQNGTCNVCAGRACSVGTDRYFCYERSISNANDYANHLCMMDSTGVCVEYYLNGSGQLIVNRGGTEYTITSKDISFNSLLFHGNNDGDFLIIKASVKSAEPNGQSMVYQTAVQNTPFQ